MFLQIKGYERVFLYNLSYLILFSVVGNIFIVNILRKALTIT